jgi:SAM-dependent methyltransferase
MIPWQLQRHIPLIRRAFDQRDVATDQCRALAAEIDGMRNELNEMREFTDSNAAVLQYRRAYHEAHGSVAPSAAMPSAKAYPASGSGLSYKQKLTGLLPVETGLGAEIGPLNIPLLSKQEANVLYVDHLDVHGLRRKYPTVEGIVDIDRPMVSHSLSETLKADAPLDYIVASQVFEHVPNPILWLQEIAGVIRVGGRVALSLPDRRMTFDLFREESAAADMVAAYFADEKVPDVRAVYDNQCLATAVDIPWIRASSMHPKEVIDARGARSPDKVVEDHLRLARMALDGEYLDTHCWVFTPPSFLIVMAQLAEDGLLPFLCRQFYPTDLSSGDRGSASFVVILERAEFSTDLRKSFLMPLGGLANP